MREAKEELVGPPPELRYRRRVEIVACLRELWSARELVRSLAEREVRARYKQAVIGVGWTLITPIALMLLFTVVFHRLAKVSTSGAPYPLFSYLGLLPWTFFSASMLRGGTSLVTNVTLLNRVYCPREAFPVAGVIVAAFDTCVALLGLLVLFVIAKLVPKATVVWVPVLIAVQFVFTLGATIIVAAVVVYFRDLRHALPIILQVGILATPVGYGMEAIPRSLHRLFSALNPLAPVIDGYRRTILLGLPPRWDLLLLGAATSVGMLVLGYLFFKRVEPGFADVA